MDWESVGKGKGQLDPELVYKRLKFAHFPYLRESLELFRKDNGETLKILDMGCGPGNMGSFCGGAPAFDWVGADLWTHQLEQVAQKGVYDGLVQVNLVDGLPFGDGSFDAIVCNEVLMYLPNANHALKEIHRTLRVNGKAFIYNPIGLAPNIAAFMKKLGRILYRSSDAITFDTETDWKRAKRPGRISYFSMDTLKDRIRAAGFEVDEAKGFRIFRNRLRLLKRLEDLDIYKNTVMGLAARYPYLACDLMVAATKK
jgi:SAM-dependent methyltransferase